MKCTYFTILVFILVICRDFAIAEVSKTAQKVLTTIEWISIPEGTFLMGSTPEEAAAAYEDAKLRSSMLERHTFDAELPQHQVYLSAYEISRYEITNAQYRAFIEATNRPTPRGHNGEETWLDETLNGGTQPVVGVTWFDAQAFAEWIGGSLPTEAQWERAARGTEARRYPWGNTPPKARQHANFARRYNRPVAVGQFPKGESPDGIADLAGNVWEWCLDEYSPIAYQRGSGDVSKNPLNLRFRDVLRARVIRGGAWDVGRAFLRSGLRFKFYPLDSTHTIGFRVVRPRPKIKE
ncbi:MAG: formylglycine-generating enzyme family protein [Candidatus Poribacteria bacterium]|nr:formylglycine-generating enzyme family protein [Candidatus Poribacteria bacterium]